jgi:hydrogenase small subunit
MQDVVSGRLECDIVILEGSFREKGLLKGGVEAASCIEAYARKAKHIITAGTCATFGGMFKQYDPENISGFCFDGEERTKRYEAYASKLISLPGCPIHPRWLSYVLLMLAKGRQIPIDALHRPQELYNITVHTGCSRNEYFEWKIDTEGFGLRRGASFTSRGARAPIPVAAAIKFCGMMPARKQSSERHA